MPYQMIYASEAATPMQTPELEEILVHARASNARQGITGALVYADGVFLQVLEGEAGTVTALMRQIAKDVRHETVTVLKAGDVPTALFADWDMAYASATAAQVAQWAGFSAATPLPTVLSDVRKHAGKAQQVAQRILGLLADRPQ